MKAALFTAAVLATAGAASAQLSIDVVGTPGSGVTTWTFSGSGGVTEFDGSVRTNAANSFNGADTGQFPFGLDTILDTSIQNVVFTLTGDAMLTIGSTTEAITGIFLDDDGGSADDLGIRVANELFFLQGELSSWTGSGTANVDINAFDVSGSPWPINDAGAQRIFIAEDIMVTFRVPSPSGAAVLGLAGLAAVRRRR